MRAEFVETVVVGGGQQGCGVAGSLARLGYKAVVLERGEIGQAWAHERWDSLCINTPNRTVTFPGCQYDGDDPEGYMPAREVAQRLRRYVAQMGIQVREHTPVYSEKTRAVGGLVANHRPPRKALWAGTVGNALEFYDFIVYGSVAALAFNKLFFPQASPLAGTMLALSTFAAGFLARPVGAAIFGTLGDRLGRRRVLTMTLLAMGGSTFLVGVLPTFAQIGAAAPVPC